MEFTIRRADPGDLGECVAIFNDWIEETNWMPRIHAHEDVMEHYRNTVFAKQRVFVADRANEIPAMLCLSDEAYITALYVKSKYRSCGLGKALLNTAKKQFPGGLHLWTFKANTEAQKFYRREGFQTMRETDGDNEENLPDILFHWRPAGEAK